MIKRVAVALAMALPAVQMSAAVAWGAPVAPAATAPVAGAWQAPKDGMLTDKQVVAYIAVTKAYVQGLKGASMTMEGPGASPAAAAKVIAATDARLKDLLARNGLSDAEYRWAATQVWDAKGFLLLDDISAKSQEASAAQLKRIDESEAALKVKVAACEKALKEGRRVMTPDERADAVKAAQTEQASAEEDIKVYAAATKEAADAAAQSEADAKTATALAAKPPAEISADDRENYILGKKKDVEEAVAAAKEARAKEAEGRKSLAEANAKIAAAVAKAKDPDAPATDDEKVEAKKQADEMLAAAKADLQSAMDAQKALIDAMAQMKKDVDDRRTQPAAKNAVLLKPHLKEFDEMLGQK